MNQVECPQTHTWTYAHKQRYPPLANTFYPDLNYVGDFYVCFYGNSAVLNMSLRCRRWIHVMCHFKPIVLYTKVDAQYL